MYGIYATIAPVPLQQAWMIRVVSQYKIITKRKMGEPRAYFLRCVVLKTSCINCLQAFGLLLGARTYKKSESEPKLSLYTQYLHGMV